MKDDENFREDLIIGFMACRRALHLPVMHTAAFAASDFDAVYLSFDIAPEELAASIQAIRTFQMVGSMIRCLISAK